jgi:hypothetical protein
MSRKIFAVIALCLTSLAGMSSVANGYTFILHPRLAATGGPAVDIRFNKKAIYVAESTSVTCTKDRTTAKVVYVDRKGNKILVVGQFVGMTEDGAKFDIKVWNLPGR